MPTRDEETRQAARRAWLHEAAAQAGLTLQAHHEAGVAERFAQLAAQAETLLAVPLEEDDLPAPVYRP